MPKTAIIAGAGIAGLTAALALAKAGWQVQVLEQAKALEAVGAGIQISPNGTKILQNLGVMDHLSDAMFEPQAIEMRLGATGRQIFSMPMADVAKHRWGAAYFQIHRADLIEGLYAACLDTGNVTVTFDHRIARYDTGPLVICENGSRFAGDIVIAADGIHSNIRTQLIGPDKPRFTGNVAWRCLVPVDVLGDLAPGPTGTIWAGPKKHAVTTRVHGGKTVNFVGIVERVDWNEEGWRLPGTSSEALADFNDYCPEVTAILQNAETLNRWGLFDRAPLPKWSDGAVVLIGDAAHPMLPSMAQGGVQAMEDAVTLAQLLETHTPAQAGAALFKTRIDRVSKVQKTSANNLRLFHRCNAMDQLMRYGPMWIADKVFPSVYHKRNDWIYGWEV